VQNSPILTVKIHALLQKKFIISAQAKVTFRKNLISQVKITSLRVNRSRNYAHSHRDSTKRRFTKVYNVCSEQFTFLPNCSTRSVTPAALISASIGSCSQLKTKSYARNKSKQTRSVQHSTVHKLYKSTRIYLKPLFNYASACRVRNKLKER
jgi:hypothetical protein